VTYPIFEALCKGERFPVSLLVNEFESVCMFWEWWWHNTPLNELSRPFTVAEGDEWLTETLSKEFIDTETYREFLSVFALHAQRESSVRRGHRIPREDYRSDLVSLWTSKGVQSDEPCVVLAGGGYGAGKTTVIDFLLRAGKLPISIGSLTGVDYFKAYLPEFSVLQMLGDGNASTIVQEEARLVANRTYQRMLAERRSFGWDSSLCNLSDSLARLDAAKKAGYRVVLVAVFAPLEVAIRQAMSRAKKSRRFAHPEYLPRSHKEFAIAFPKYVPLVDQVIVFVNDGADDGSGKSNLAFVAEKTTINAELAIHDRDRFVRFVS
jgi:hypothetical protein